MSEEHPKCRGYVKLASRVALGAFVVWLCWLVTVIVRDGLSQEARAELAATALVVAAGVLLSGVGAVRSTAVGTWLTAIRDILLRRSK